MAVETRGELEAMSDIGRLQDDTNREVSSVSPSRGSGLIQPALAFPDHLTQVAEDRNEVLDATTTDLPGVQPVSAEAGIAGTGEQDEEGGGSNAGEAGGATPFFDPLLSEAQRALAFNVENQIADLQLRGQRLVSDVNLMRPFIERRFRRQTERAGADVARRGFAGSHQGILAGTLSDLSRDQTFESAQFERRTSRELTDIERAIARLGGEATIQGSEDILSAARRRGNL